MRGLADRLGTAPTAIYTFFESKDALLQALAERALADLWVEPDAGTHWEQAIATWMHDLHDTLLDARWIGDLIALTSSSPQLLQGVGQLAERLRCAGVPFPDAALLAQNLLWTVLGFVMLQIDAEGPDLVPVIEQARHQQGYEELIEHIAIGEYDKLYALTVYNAVAGIRARIET